MTLTGCESTFSALGSIDVLSIKFDHRLVMIRATPSLLLTKLGIFGLLTFEVRHFEKSE